MLGNRYIERQRILNKIKELKYDLKKSTGMGFRKYNREIFMNKDDNFNWDDIICRQIVLLNNLVRMRK